MKNLLLSLPLLLLLKCGGDPATPYRLKIDTPKKQLTVGNTLKLEIDAKKDQPIDSIQYFWDGTPIDASYTVAEQKLGSHWVSAWVYAAGSSTEVSKTLQLYAASPPALYTYTILNEFPHDPTAYTQGLEFDGEDLYESTGLRGQSTLRRLNYSTGEIQQQVALNAVYFGEGLTLLNDQIYQLTWQENLAFVYDKAGMETLRSFAYQDSKEGWGLCNDGNRLYKSDGSNALWILDPATGQEIDKIEVMTHKAALNKLNELEWVDGKIYANTYQFNKEVAVIINPQNGAVEGVIDFSGLKERVDQIPTLNVLNGIAYHPGRQSFFVTGKNWSKLFEVALSPQ